MKNKLFFFYCLFVILQSQAQEIKTSKGVYEFLSDDASKPFHSDKIGTIAKNGMVSSAHPEASKIGVLILKMGGNAIDAAIATHFALAVVHPAAGNIGGGGFLVYRQADGSNFSLDFREKAPTKATHDMYLDQQKNVIPNLSLSGHLASGIPGSVAGMEAMHKKFGKLSWKKLLIPAVNLALKGVVLTEKEARGLNRIKNDLLTYNPNKKYFLKPDNADWQAGDLLVQADLANTLRRIQRSGSKDFYEGKTAELIISEMKHGKGIITTQDLKNYQATWREALISSYKNYKIIGMPPPSSGGVALAQLLKLVEPYPLKDWGWHSDSATQVMIEAERRVFADRAKWLGDPDFVQVPVQELISEAYLKKRWESFDFKQASDSKNISAGEVSGYESPQTTHYSVVDKDGNAVSITTTLNNSYGSKVVVAGGGFLMNDEMDDFSIKPNTPNMYGLIGSEANAIRADKRMLSSMTPTIVEQKGKLLIVVGTPGGSTIITSVFQIILNVIEHGMNMQQAVNAYRFHHQWLPDKTLFEQNSFDEKTIENLQRRGYTIEMQKNTIGRMDCIRVLDNGTLEGGADPRGDDSAQGY